MPEHEVLDILLLLLRYFIFTVKLLSGVKPFSPLLVQSFFNFMDSSFKLVRGVVLLPTV